jgi:hypothetical protein
MESAASKFRQLPAARHWQLQKVFNEHRNFFAPFALPGRATGRVPNERQPRHCFGRIIPVARLTAGWFVDQPTPLVKAHGFDADPGLPCDLSDRHSLRCHREHCNPVLKYGVKPEIPISKQAAVDHGSCFDRRSKRMWQLLTTVLEIPKVATLPNR